MKIEYFKGEAPNFGDELNPWLWPRLLPSFFDDDASTLFIGIGSIIRTQYARTARKVVFGAGFVPSYNDLPRAVGPDWDIRFVRGPRTARALGLPDEVGIGDWATLLRIVDYPLPAEPNYVGYMPHWQSLLRGDWGKVCAQAGLRLIDPRAEVETVLTDLLGCRLLVTEAMHGAIVADALRIPWIQASPIEGRHRDKWLDWADSLNLRLRPHPLWPSSLTELRLKVGPTIKRHLGSFALPVVRAFRGRAPIASTGAAPAVPEGRSPSGFWDSALSMFATQRLTVLAKQEPMLSGDSTIDSVTNRMAEELLKLERSYRKKI